MALLDARLDRAVKAVAYALSQGSELRLREAVCGDTSELAWKLLRDVGIYCAVLGASLEQMGAAARVEPIGCAGHEWIRIEGVNIDFAAQQFGKPFPYITLADSLEAVLLYGPGSVTPDPDYESWDDYTIKQMIYPPVEMVDEALGTRGGLKKLDEFWGDDAQVTIMKNTLKSFRAFYRR